jgi:hypothetical protein
VKHGSAAPRPDDSEITGAMRVTIAVGKEEQPQKRTEKEKRHLFPLLSLSFVSLSFLQNPLALSILFVSSLKNMGKRAYILTCKSRAAFS